MTVHRSELRPASNPHLHGWSLLSEPRWRLSCHCSLSRGPWAARRADR